MYRILTENKHPEKVKNLLKTQGIDYTMYPASGSWQGKPEISLVIELADSSPIRNLAKRICEVNEQECVMVQHIQAATEFIYREL